MFPVAREASPIWERRLQSRCNVWNPSRFPLWAMDAIYRKYLVQVTIEGCTIASRSKLRARQPQDGRVAGSIAGGARGDIS